MNERITFRLTEDGRHLPISSLSGEGFNYNDGHRHNYDGDTLAQHRNHIHFAVNG